MANRWGNHGNSDRLYFLVQSCCRWWLKPWNLEKFGVGEDSWESHGQQGNQTRTDAEAETSILWPPDVKNWPIGKDPESGKDRRQEKGTTGDEMVGWHPDSMVMNLSKLWEIVKDREAWHDAVHGVAKNQTWLSDWTECFVGSVPSIYLFFIYLAVPGLHFSTWDVHCRTQDLVLQPETKRGPLAFGAQSFKHWNTKEVTNPVLISDAIVDDILQFLPR